MKNQLDKMYWSVQQPCGLSLGQVVGATRQRGMATLLVTIVLVVVTTLGALAVSRSTFFERQMVGTDIRNKEVYAAATSGLDVAVDWLGHNQECWADESEAGEICEPEDMVGDALDLELGQGNETYDHVLSYELLTDFDAEGPTVIKVISTATAQNDSQITKTVEAKVIQSNLLRASFIDEDEPAPPPLVVEHCIDPAGAPSGPKIYIDDEPIAIGTTEPIAIGTTAGDSKYTCLDEGSIRALKTQDGATVPMTRVDDNGNTVPSVPKGRLEHAPIALWTAIFGAQMTEAVLSDMSSHEGFEQTVIYVDAAYATNGHYAFNGTTWGTSVGDADNQVILYFDSSVGCPAIDGATVIHGLVYYETEGCDKNQTWGGGTIHGVLAFEGDRPDGGELISLFRLDASARLYVERLDSFVGFNKNITLATIVPGSWRDFEDD